MSAYKEQLVEDQLENKASQNALPLSATINDIRALVKYLKKKPQGASIGGMTDVIKKQIFEQSKISAYELLGIIEEAEERITLSPWGLKLAESFENEAEIFRLLMSRIERYRKLLQWAIDQQLDALLHSDVVTYFGFEYPDRSATSQDAQMINNVIVCLFQVCQAAGLGTHIIGKKGQPTRLRLDRDAVLDFIKNSPDMGKMESSVQVSKCKVTLEKRHKFAYTESGKSNNLTVGAPHKPRVFVSVEEDQEIARRIRYTFELADLECQFAVKNPSETIFELPSPELMRDCHAAVIIITKDDIHLSPSGKPLLKEEKQVEIGAAYILYENMITLLWSDFVEIPDNLHALKHYHFTEDELSWETCIKLAKEIKESKSTCSTHRFRAPEQNELM